MIYFFCRLFVNIRVVFEKQRCNAAHSFKILLIDKVSIKNYLLEYSIFFEIIVAIVQTFLKSGYKLLYPTAMEDDHLLSKPQFKFNFDLIIVVDVLPCKMLVEEKEGVEVAVCKVRDIRMTLDSHSIPINRVALNGRAIPINFCTSQNL